MTDKRLTVHTGKSKRAQGQTIGRSGDPSLFSKHLRPPKKPSARKVKRAADLFAPKR